MSGIVVATSIPPSLARNEHGQPAPGYQSACVASWLACGFRVVSVNAPGEIAPLAQQYPQVQFVEGNFPGNAFTNRPLPPIASLLASVAGAPESTVGIMNSDIRFDEPERWAADVVVLAREATVIGNRIDVDALSSVDRVRMIHGFDHFFFARVALQQIVARPIPPFCIGQPWWDLWLPLAFEFAGRPTVCLDHPTVTHLTHDQAWSYAAWRSHGLAFVNDVLRRRTGAHGGLLGEALEVCDFIAQNIDEASPATIDRLLGWLAVRCARHLRINLF